MSLSPSLSERRDHTGDQALVSFFRPLNADETEHAAESFAEGFDTSAIASALNRHESVVFNALRRQREARVG